MNHIEFSVIRLRQIWATDWESPEFLAEVAYLYDQMVKTGSHEPVIDMGMKLMIPFESVGEAVALAMEEKYIAAPKKGTWGGEITNKARKVLGQPTMKPASRESSQKKVK